MIWFIAGDVKTFFVATFPYPLLEAPEIGVPDIDQALEQAIDPLDDPTGQGTADFRLKAVLEAGDWKFEVHNALTSFSVPLASSPLGAAAGVGLTAPELVDLTWQPDTGDGLTVRSRVDRLTAKLSVPHLDVIAGRQPVTFGNGLVFTPMDVVNPFSAATIDSEYKPGVDALRMDAYVGMSGRITGVGAWAGAPIHDADRDKVQATDVILAANGQTTVGVSDIQLLVGAVRGEAVMGAGVVSSIGVFGVHADATVTVPAEEDAFARAVAGAMWRPGMKTTLTGEAYYQGFGATDPDGYWDVLSSDRFARGEVWQAGQVYAAVSWGQEISSLVSGNVAVIGNLIDPSALLAPGLSWSVSDEASLGVGGFVGVGQRPDPLQLGLDPATFELVYPPPDAYADALQSEFGLYPAAAYLSLKAYF